jgi:pyruvate formate lyase activating enzyme
MNNMEKNHSPQTALYYNPKNDGTVQCMLCPHSCIIHDSGKGLCQVRENRGGKLYSLNYGQITARALDPIEKKPLYHFHPGSSVFSIGTFGCNFHCQFCQNWHISQGSPPTEFFTPEQSVEEALFYKDTHKCIGIAFTYSEPVVWYEYLLDTARLAKAAGLKNIMVTNGYIQNQPLQELLPWIDAVNIDLKAFTEEFYQDLCQGRLDPVKQTVLDVYGKCHLELTVLLIPGKNDSTEELEILTEWISAISPSIPVHFSRYFPHYKMHIPPTPIESLERAYRTARKKLRYVYIGNVPGHQGVNTVCYNCGEELITRKGTVHRQHLTNQHKCSRCGAMLDLESE